MKSSSHEFFDEVAAISTPHNLPNNAYIFFPIALYPVGLEDHSGAAPTTAFPQQQEGRPGNPERPSPEVMT